MRNRYLILIIISFFSIASALSPQPYTINLDLPPFQRYKSLGKYKQQSINRFLNALQSYKLYKVFFFLAQIMTPILPHIVGQQFFLQCKSFALGSQLHVSQIVVLNYMYQLGAWHDFCTSIAVQLPNKNFFLARNLDYGFQQYLIENSLELSFVKNNSVILKTVGHAGFIGTHTAIRIGQNGQTQYALTLNQRIDGGFHQTFYHFFNGCQTGPYLMMKALRQTSSSAQALKMLSQVNLCAPIYYIFANNQQNILIQRKRKGVENGNIINFIVQTNCDQQSIDPDGRRDIAIIKMQNLQNHNSISPQTVSNLLYQYPNFNNLTLFTAMLKSKGQVKVQLWPQ